MGSVSIGNVWKYYGNVEVIRDVSLDIRDGEFLTLVGPSGCGKSTLLRMIAGLEEITAGEIRINGRVVNDLEPKDRDIAMVFQNYALYPHMTVFKNMAFSMRLRKASDEEMRQAVEKAAEILNLGELLERYPRQLSGGQRQRVAMGRAIVRDPQAFLFDEPLSNLDAKLRVQMRIEIKQMHQRLGTTTIYVTHDQVEAMTLADRIVVLNNGVIEQIGTPMELFDWPANRFVADFIGSPSMNFVTGTVAKGAAGPELRVEGGGPGIPLPDEAGSMTGRRVLYGIRPEHLTLGSEQGVACQVSVVEPNGSETMIVAGNGSATFTVVLHERVSFRPGDSVRLSAKQGCAHFFDPDSGQRLAIE